MEQLQLIVLSPLDQNIDRLITTICPKGVINLRTTKEQRGLQVLEMVLFQEGRVCETADFAGSVCERVANVGGSEAVSELSDCDSNETSCYSAYPTQAYLVSGLPYSSLALAVHSGTFISAYSVFSAFQTSKSKPGLLALGPSLWRKMGSCRMG